jgi:hypothetical protein
VGLTGEARAHVHTALDTRRDCEYRVIRGSLHATLLSVLVAWQPHRATKNHRIAALQGRTFGKETTPTTGCLCVCECVGVWRRAGVCEARVWERVGLQESRHELSLCVCAGVCGDARERVRGG